MKAQWKEAYAPCSFAKTFAKHKSWKLRMERLDSIIDLQGSRKNQKKSQLEVISASSKRNFWEYTDIQLQQMLILLDKLL